MTRSSPWRRSQVLSSPDRQYFSDFLGEDRNTELSHRDALAAAHAEHERVREAAVRAFELHEMQEEHKRILEAEKRERERLETEARIAAEEKRLQELRAKSIPKPTPPPPSSAPIAQSIEKPTSTDAQQPASQTSPSPAEARATPQTSVPLTQAKSTDSTPFAQPNGAITSPQTQPPSSKPLGTTSSPFGQANGVRASPSPFSAQPVAQTKPAPPVQPATSTQPVGDDRYTMIHKELKKLRSNLQAQAKAPGSPMKGQIGTLRREIRVSIGQLTSGGQKGANTTSINKIVGALRQAVEGQIQSPPINVSTYVTDSDRQPTEGALNNEVTMPSLFIYLINICAKAFISQYINECGANPKAADPIGVVAAHIFSQKEFQWRGKTLIDILIAKFRVVCPALFGFRGKDTTERGRLALGWKRDGPSWIPEQNHRDRMAGLGAGYASISLRDFSKSSKTNPYPPTHYWEALAGIVNTPANETSDTQYVVLRAMIEGHEPRFLNFYGNAGLAALRMALVEFPKKAPPKSAAAGSLQALAELLRTEEGLALG